MAFLKNVALSIHADVAPFTAEAVKTSKSLPKMVDVRLLIQVRSIQLKLFYAK